MLLSSAALLSLVSPLFCSFVAVSEVLRALSMLMAVSVHVALSLTGSKTQ